MIRLRFVSLHILSNPSNFSFDFHGQNWLNNEYATWGNIKNYYTEPSSRPKHLDYVFYRKESDRVQTSSFSVSNGECAKYKIILMICHHRFLTSKLKGGLDKR